jgi:hypothetical protein
MQKPQTSDSHINYHFVVVNDFSLQFFILSSYEAFIIASVVTGLQGG